MGGLHVGFGDFLFHDEEYFYLLLLLFFVIVSENANIVNTFSQKIFAILFLLNIHMTLDEKEALVVYLEARLLEFCMQAEHHWHNGGITSMYDDMYVLLSDIESSMEGHIELEVAKLSKKST